MIKRFHKNFISSKAGLTVAELMIAAVILSILAVAVIPVARMTVKRTKEIELQRALRIMRDAIDKYKDLVDEGKIESKLDEMGYPPNLEILVEGIPLKEDTQKKIKILRRIPKNPFTGEREWGFRSLQDDYDSTSWGEENVFDVYSLYNSTALDGSEYKDW
ncbi:MAG: type II secretion system protein [Acidobacteria bacterium]|nr:type II secretion system protein [Acidobacteriota bacterium]